jgi:hypothetical protein
METARLTGPEFSLKVGVASWAFGRFRGAVGQAAARATALGLAGVILKSGPGGTSQDAPVSCEG